MNNFESGKTKKWSSTSGKDGRECRFSMTEMEIFFFIREEPYGFLSNFWRATQVVDGVAYDCNERYYQCQKAGTPKIRAWIFNAPSPYLAMVAGHHLRANHILPDGSEIRSDWTENTRLCTMLRGLRAKFTQNSDLAKLLLSTGNARLHEDNQYDAFWGVGEPEVPRLCEIAKEQDRVYKPKGADYLGKLLMQIREELRKGELST